jgi:hypothetical protein
MFIMINNILRDWVIDQLTIDLKRYLKFLK